MSFAVPRGGMVALLGANGAGKTTTLNAIAGLVQASHGTIEWDGQPIASLAPLLVVLFPFGAGQLRLAHGFDAPRGRVVEERNSCDFDMRHAVSVYPFAIRIMPHR